MTKFCGQVNIPTVNNDPIACANFFDTDCVIYQNPIAYFGTNDPSTSTEVFDFIIASLIDARTRLGTVEGTILPTTHADLLGLNNDDHTQYHTDARALTWLGTRSTSDLPEGTNEYFTQARTLGTILTGLNVALTGDVVATDSVLDGFGKLQYQIDNFTAGGQVNSVVAGTNISVDNTDPINPTVSATNVVTTNTNQTTGVTGNKTWSGVQLFSGSFQITGGTPHLRMDIWNTAFTNNSTQGGIYVNPDGNIQIFNPTGVHSSFNLILNNSGHTALRTATFPDKSGTLAMLDDITGGGAISDTAYGVGWDGDTTTGASKNALYDKIQTLVDLSTNQTITGRKIFSGTAAAPAIAVTGHARFNGTIPTFNDSTAGFGYDTVSDTWFFQEQSGVLNFGQLDFKSISATRTFTFPNKDGTVAMLSDIPAGATISDIAYAATWDGNLDGASKNAIYDKIETLVTLGTFQTITGAKIFGAETNHNGGIVVGDGVTTTPTGNRVQFTNTVSPGALQSSSYAGIGMNNNDIYWHQAGANSEFFTKLATSNTGARTHTLPDKSGTVAHTSDLPTRTTGTFTPTLTGSLSGTYTFGGATGSWVKFGSVIHFSILFNTPNGTAPTGNLIVGNLPWDFAGSLVNGSVTISGVTSPTNPRDLNIKGSGVTGELIILYNNGFDNTTPIGDVDFDGSGQLSIVGSFMDTV